MVRCCPSLLLPAWLRSSLRFIRSTNGLGRLIGQAAVRPILMIVPTPSCDHHLCLLHGTEPLHVQACVPQPPAYALAIRVVPRTARRNVHRLHVPLLQPPLHGPRDTLRTMVTAYIHWSTTYTDHPVQHLATLMRTHTRCTLNRPTFPRTRIRQRHDLQALAMRTRIMHNVVRPHLIGLCYFHRTTDRPISPAFSRATTRHAQALLAPDAMHACAMHRR